MPPPAEGFAARLLLGPALRAQPDGRLVKLVREGYEAAFDEIVRRYGSPLRRYAASIAGGSADDVTQDALSKAFIALRGDDREIELRPWLYRILRNTALNDLRDRPPRTAELGDSIEAPRAVAEEVERREEIDELIGRLRALPEPQRAAIVMRELEGLGHQEIATALGISGGAARQAIHRARTALRDGFGMAIPLPLLKLMLEGGGPAAEVAAGGAGAGIVLKAATATVLVAGTLGAGMALHDGSHGNPTASVVSENSGDWGSAQPSTASAQLAATPSASRGSAGAHDEGRHGDSSGRGDGISRTEGGEDRHEGGNQGRSGQHEGAGDGPTDPRPSQDGSGSGGSSTGDGDSTLSDGDSGSGDGLDGGESSSGEQVSGSEDGTESNSGPDSGGGEEPSTSGSGDSGDYGGGEGFSGQMQFQTEEER
jgi:RNA polymerase sigma factor (sigma-70 family)